MDAFRTLAAAASVSDKKDQLCSRGWIVTKDVESLRVGDPFNVCLRIEQQDTAHHGIAEIVNLKLGNGFGNSPPNRFPQCTGEKVHYDSSALRRRLPATVESAGCILLPTRADEIVGIAEIFCGGISGWSRAAQQLPAYPVIRLDHCGMCIANTMLNEPSEILYNEAADQSHFSVFWGEALDLRWTAALDHGNVEVLCCSPPSLSWGIPGPKQGLADSVNTVAWWELALLARVTQRRAVIVETSLQFAVHEDAKTFDEMMLWAGYVVSWRGKIEASTLVPTERPRHFIIYWNAADQPSAGTPLRMVRLGVESKKTCDGSMWHDMEYENFKTTEVKQELLPKVLSRELLPLHLRAITGSPLHLRSVKPYLPLPTPPPTYHDVLEMPWPVLFKRGMNLPVVDQNGRIRLINKWEMARAMGLPAEIILPDPEGDAAKLLAQAVVPAQALQVLAATIAHRQEKPLEEKAVLKYIEEGTKDLGKGWTDFSLLEPFAKDGWATLILKGADAERTTSGRLRSRLIGLQHQLDNLVRMRQTRTPLLPETCRPLYDELIEEEEVHYEHKIFQVDNGYVGMLLNEEDTVASIHVKIADYIGIPPHLLAVSKVNNQAGGMDRWVVTGELNKDLNNHALVLVDTAIPQAQWLPAELYAVVLTKAFQDHHSSMPDILELNGTPVIDWPIALSSGDYLRLRWNGFSDHEDWKDLDIFKETDVQEEDVPVPPDTPNQEGDESSPGGPEEDPATSDTEPMPPAPGSPQDTPPVADDSQPARGMPFQDIGTPSSKRPRTCLPTISSTAETPAPTLMNYSQLSPPSPAASIFFRFQGQLMACGNTDTRSLIQVVTDQWGVDPSQIYFTMEGKILGHDTLCRRIPSGAAIIVRGKLRGGTGNGAILKKLKGLLQSKGVPPEQLEARIDDIKNQLGDRGIRDIYESFDPWSKLKASCNFRLVREAEAKAKPKSKDIQKDDGSDPLQEADPWASAIRERKAWKLEASFFKLQDGSQPATLEKITHGASGICLVAPKEAEILLQQQDVMSSDELAAVVIGAQLQSAGRFCVKDLEIPCRNGDEQRVLVRAQLINLGAKEVGVCGEDTKIVIDELDGAILSCEILRADTPDWDDLTDGVIKFLKKRLPSLETALFANWGRRFFAKGKPVGDGKIAESCFLMLRIKKEFRDAILKTTSPGIYLAPRTEDGAPDHLFKVVWFQDKTAGELAILANSEPKSFGLVKNKSGVGIRVKAKDFTRLKQKWQPTWQPQDGTPYGLNIKCYFDVQNLPVSCSKTEVQKFLNTIKWNALAIRQTRPRIWLIGAEGPPSSTVHVAGHGTVLITERSAKAQGKGKSSIRPVREPPWVVATASSSSGGRTLFLLQLVQLLLELVLKNLGEIKQENQSVAQQLSAQLSQLTAAIHGQKADLSAELQAAQGSLKTELMGEMRQQMPTIRLANLLDGPAPLINNYRFSGPCMQRTYHVDDGFRARKSGWVCHEFFFNSDRDNSFQPHILCNWMWYNGIRVGEAKNPGPATMKITGLNAQSLNSFLDDKRFLASQADVTVFSETCATHFVEQKATKVAHAAGKHVCFGKPVPKRTFKDHRDCATKGKAQGVAILSECPMRRPCQTWSDDSWDTCRVTDSFLLTQSGMIRIFAFYGFHQGHDEADIKNESLLREIASRASSIDVPTVIVGDFNCALQDLAVWEDMCHCGWKDSALVMQQWTGDPPAMTFGEISRLDYVVFNSKAAPAFRDMYLSLQPETDHKSITAVFDWSALPSQIKQYRMPMDIAKLDLQPHTILHADPLESTLYGLDKAIASGDTDNAWLTFCSTYESTIDQLLQKTSGVPLRQSFQRRGKATFSAGPVAHLPTSRARSGEFQPTGDESTILLRQRVRQIRRLETFFAQKRRLETVELDQAAVDKLHNATIMTWRSILAATGFGTSFRKWWLDEIRDDFPLHLPRSSLAFDMIQILKKQEVHWRQTLKRHRNKAVTQVFEEDWKKGGSKFYRAVRPPGRPKVDSLDVSSHHRINVARARQKGPISCRMLDDDLQCVVIGSIWKQGKASAKVAKITRGNVHLRPLTGSITTGDILQVVPTASPSAILHATKDYWNTFWNMKRDKGTHDDVFQEALHLLPALQEANSSFNQQDLDHALSSLQTNRARGMDAFSNFELKYMPYKLRPALLALLNLFTSSAKWPKELCLARMALLYKSDQVGEVSSTRPITILASVLRLWAKLVTRKMFSHLKSYIPPSLFGSVPGRSATDMVGILQTRLEAALLDKDDLYGVSLDFSKAYNTLPRHMLEQINVRLGMKAFWQPYSDYLGKLDRYFVCSKTWSEPISSQVGVPEGCPIAVVQMILITWLCTLYVNHKSGSTLYSYVDDWVILFNDSDQAAGAIQSIQDLANSLGMILSLQKSTVFATQTSLARSIQGKLQSVGLVLGQAKNFSESKAKVLLNRLQYMPWSVQRKTDIINRCIFPLTFYGCNTWRAGKDFTREVRAKCNHAVWGKKQYHLHYLTPLFSGTAFEPLLYMARYRFAAFLRLLTQHEQLVKDVWAKSVKAKTFFKNSTKGAISLLQNLLFDLDWEIYDDGTCVTGQGWKFPIWDISLAQFLDSARRSWENNILRHLHSKNNLKDLDSFSVSFSQQPRHDDKCLEGFMRKVRLGGLFPYRRKNHVTQEDLACLFCGQEDTLQHRVYECVGTEHIRATDRWDAVSLLPPALVLGGLVGEPKELEDFHQALDRLEPSQVSKLPPTSSRRFCFTDGSAFGVDDSQAIICSWAVTEATQYSPSNTCREQGLLVGRRQTVFRAELQAVNVALAISDSCTIYCDNESVVRRVQQIIAGQLSGTVLIQHKDRDLLRNTVALVKAKVPGSIAIVWTKAHRQPHEASGAQDLWCIHHNNKADFHAKQAGKTVPHFLLQAQLKLLQKIQDTFKSRSDAACVLRAVMDEFP
ncbi:RTase [Symbiodinium sp. CCMP2592]|nr:RTase [Symbiodinium sp. CCMP2592]